MMTYARRQSYTSPTLLMHSLKINHEVLLGIDANEPNILYNNGVSQLLQRTQLIDIIDELHGLYKVPNTYIRGRYRIGFFLATKYISTFIDRSGINSFNEVTTSDHRGKFIDLRLRDCFKKNHTLLFPMLHLVHFNLRIQKALQNTNNI